MKKINLLTILTIPTALSLTTIATSCVNTNANQEIYKSAIEYIQAIANIPHVSNDLQHQDSLKEINAYIMDTAKKYVNPDTVQTDDVGNVWFDIPASSGCKNYKKIALQAHMDMVWAAQGEAKEWDRWTHPCSPAIVETIDGIDFIHGKDYLTNIGTDDSCGMAYMLAIAKNHKDFKHGTIRCIFTTNEENGEPGAEVLGRRRNKGDINVLDHNEGYDYLINIDSGPLGNVVFNAAGGFLGDFKDNDIVTQGVNGNQYELSITKCLGGHSGTNIGDGRINCLQTIGKMVSGLYNNSLDCHIYEVQTPNCTGTSIPTEVIVKFISSNQRQEILNVVEPIYNSDKEKFKDVEKDIEMSLSDATTSTQNCLPTSYSQQLFNFLPTIDYGVLERYTDPSEHDAIKCSANLGPLTIDLSGEADNQMVLHVAGRYQEKTDLERYKANYDEIYNIFKLGLGCDYSSGAWNPWDGKKDNPICNMCIEAYDEIGVEGIKGRVHGGLECAEFNKYNEYINSVSLGPTNENEHSVYETLNLDSYLKFIKMMEKVFLKLK